MKRFVRILGVCVLVTLPSLGAAQDRTETLADIRQELSVLYVEIQKLKRELNTTGGAGQLSSGGSLLDRVNAIEGELQRLTSKTEELEFRVGRVAEDGANRIGDLEFRLCELEEGCDIGALGESTTLGGVEGATGDGAVLPDAGSGGDAGGPQMAVAEQSDFDAAKAAMEAGSYEAAAEKFAAFRQTYPGGPLTGQAGLLQGESLEGAGQLTQAARVYLDLFSADPNGDVAPQALFRLGRSLGRLGKTEEACVTLAEVETRFPQSDAVLEAQSSMRNLGCE
ncbi:tol-pal system protein YbgF [Roseovarius sp. MMSF_3281]|uniref:tol-pal system protein YbgF n=1 Tax=Roseovarius sp. MMSF_3281 TaxID=3046694 RepID=UPI00273DC1A2|nr:tol-pal system protein YbgF [Roseovarius sp. MMSF_3281]